MKKLTISFDFELGWGVLDSSLWRQRESVGTYEHLRGVLSSVFSSLADHNVPTTWATVAAMLNSPMTESDLDHLPDHYRKAVLEFQQSANTLTFDARDIVDQHWNKIQSFSEIASHTATHIYPGSPGVTSSCYTEDVALSFKILEKYFGETIKSMVFTRDDTTFLEEVANLGNLNVRTECQAYGRGSDSGFTRLLKGGRRYVDRVPQSEIKKSLKNCTTQSGSLYFNWAGGRYAYMKKLQLDLQVERLFRQLVSDDSGSYHIWLHPFNLVDTPNLASDFILFLERVVALRDSGEIEIMTMSDFACTETK